MTKKTGLAYAPPPTYPDDLIHIDRWMCPNCGLIFDFSENHSIGEPGWIDTDPPDGPSWVDPDGGIHDEFIGICSRCGISLEDSTLIRVLISRATNLSDWVPIIEQSEHHSNEFKLQINDGDKLGKEIASFATSNGGRIFLGVDKRGDIQGFEGIDTVEGKDLLQQRIRGIVNNIKPKPFCPVDFASGENINIAIISIQGGIAPVFYFKGRPYIRELEESRPAEPDEVQRLISEWKERGN